MMKYLDIKYKYNGKCWKIPAFSLIWLLCMLGVSTLILGVPVVLSVLMYILVF